MLHVQPTISSREGHEEEAAARVCGARHPSLTREGVRSATDATRAGVLNSWAIMLRFLAVAWRRHGGGCGWCKVVIFDFSVVMRFNDCVRV
jgi:hypothetical protein